MNDTDLDYKRGLLRVYGTTNEGKTSQEIVGAAFLVSGNRALTCAHVVCSALGKDNSYRPNEKDQVTVDFVHLPANPSVKATIEGWYAFQTNNPVFNQAEDIAVLRIIDPLPDGAEAFNLMVSKDNNVDVKVQGFPNDDNVDDIVEGQLLGSTAQGWVQLDTRLAQKAIIPGFSGAPVWNSTYDVVGMMSRSTTETRTSDSSPSAYMIPTTMLQKALPLLFNPYKGLQAFQEEDSGRYYGRSQQIKELIMRLNQEPHIAAVVGDSGSGKSSLVFAGLLPHLRKQHWHPIIFRPRSDPFAELARALRNDTIIGNMPSPQPLNATSLQNDMALLYELAQSLQDSNDKKLMLIVDQFEEVYTLTSGDQTVGASDANSSQNSQQANQPMRQSGGRGRDFVEKLLHTLQSQHKYEAPMLGLVLTMRYDFGKHALASVTFTEVLNQHEYLLGAIRRDNLIEAVEAPAHKQNVHLEDGLTDLILRDVNMAAPPALDTSASGEDGNPRLHDSFDGSDLPLVQFALTELWKQQKYRHGHYTLTLADYNAIGGVRGALGKYADMRYQRLSDEDRARVKAIFIALIRLEEMENPTREILDRTHFSQDQWELIKRLDKERLLVLGHEDERQQDTVEVMHEALISGWGTLNMWVSRSQEFLLWRTRLRRAMQEWEKRGKPRDELLRGSRLKEAEVQLAQHRERLGQPETDYIQKSTQSRKRRRTIATGLGVAVASVLAALVVLLLIQATDLRRERDVALSRQLAAQARLAATEPNVLNGLRNEAPLLAVQAVKTNPNTTSNIQLYNLLHLIHPVSHFLHYSRESLPNYATHVAFSHDGSKLASAGRFGSDGVTTIWDLTQDSPTSQTLSFFDVESWPPRRTSSRLLRTNPVNHITFNPKSSQLASAADDGRVVLVSFTEDLIASETLLESEEPINHIAFNNDGSLLASAGDNGNIHLFNLTQNTSTPQVLSKHQHPVTYIAFSHDGSQLASASDNDLFLWDLTQPLPEAKTISNNQRTFTHVAFNHDGSQLVSASTDGHLGTVTLWNLTQNPPTPQSLTSEFNLFRSVNHVTFNHDGSYLAVANDSHFITLWELNENPPKAHTLAGHPSPTWVNHVTFNHDGSLLASADMESNVILWELNENPPKAHTLAGHTGFVNHVVFNHDSSQLASAGDNLILWNVTQYLPMARTLSGHQSSVTHVAFNHDDSQLVTTSNDNTTILWNLTQNAPTARTLAKEPLSKNQYSRFLQAIFNHNSSKLVSAYSDYDGSITLWDLTQNPAEAQVLLAQSLSTQPLPRQFQQLPLGLSRTRYFHATFNHDSSLLASAGYDGSVLLRNLTKDPPTAQVLPGHQGSITHAVFNHDSSLLASAGYDGSVLLWDLTKDPPTAQVLLNHSDPVHHIAFNHDSSLLASASSDGPIGSLSSDFAVTLWDLTQSSPSAQVITTRGSKYVTFNHDSSLLASTHHNYEVILWDLTRPTPSAQALVPYQGSFNYSHDSNVAFNHDGSLLASAGHDDNVILWHLEQDPPVAQLLSGHQGLINHVAFSNDSSLLASASNDGNIILWDIDPQSWQEKACRIAGRNFTMDEWHDYMGEDREYELTCPQFPPGEGAPITTASE